MRQFTRPLAVAHISAGTLSFEILLVRVFAIEHFYHFAYMAIGVAMLGVGVSGTAVALMPRLRQSKQAKLFAHACGVTAVVLAVTPALVLRIPLDPTQLMWDASQWWRLTTLYGLLALPFAFGALATVLALTMTRERPGRIYGAGFLGSGAGVALALGSLWIMSLEHALALPALLAALGLLLAVFDVGLGAKSYGVAAAVLAATAVAVITPPWTLTVSPYKGLPQVEAYPDSRRIAEQTNPIGWTVAVDAAAFRLAPGLSLAYSGTLPRQAGIFVDGSTVGAISSNDHDSQLYDWVPTALPYAIAQPQRVLIIGAGGDNEIRNAIAHEVPSVTVVEMNPDVMRLTAGSGSGRVQTEGRIEWIVADARSHITRTDEAFDLISIAPTSGFGTGAAGVHGLAEDFLHTTDAYEAYLHKLTDDGMLAITRWLTTPPRASVRVILTAAAALREMQPETVARGLVVMRSWGTTTVLVKPTGFTQREIELLREWTAPRLFDLDWPRGAAEPDVVFNQMDEPTLYRAAAATAAGTDSADRFAAEYPFNVAPVSDAQPYPHHFLRLSALGALLGEDRGSLLPFAEWGLIALVATLAQSALLAGLFIILPVVFLQRTVADKQWLYLVAYFGAIGLAYMAAEIAAIQQLALLLGHPIYAVAIVLVAILVFSGVGSAYSDRLAATKARPVTLVLVAVVVLCALVLLPLVHGLQAAATAARTTVAVALLAPLGLLMGLPFPLGLRLLASGDRANIAWAWAANGFASVVAVPLAALIALEVGSPALFMVAAGGYSAAAVLTFKRG